MGIYCSQNAAAAAKTEDQKQEKRWEQVETQLKAEAEKHEKLWEQAETRLRALEEVMAPLRGIPNLGSALASLAQLGDMPQRMSVVEDGLTDTITHVKHLDSHVHQIDNDLQELDSDFSTKAAKGGAIDSVDLTERIQLLEQRVRWFTS